MTTPLGEAFVPIRATMEKLDGDLAEARGRIQGALDGIGGSIQALGGMALTGIATGILAVGAAVGTIGAFAFDAGMMVDDAMDSIAIATGAVGGELDSLQSSFETVFSSVPTDAGTAADVIGTLNARLGITGEELDDLAVPLAQVTELIGGDAVTRTELFTRVLGDWGVEVEDGAATLDTFFVASQETGAGMDDLMAKVVQFGSPLRLMGFSLEESIALFAQWEQQGVNAELVMGSLRIAAGNFADANIPLRDGLMATMEAIQNAGSESEALSIAMETFGARAGPDMAAAILEGRFAIDDLVAAMQNSEGAIMDTAAQTADFGEMFTLLKNKATLALAPLGAMLIDVANALFERLQPALDTVFGIAHAFFDEIANGEGPLAAVMNLLRTLGVPEETRIQIHELLTAVQEFIANLQSGMPLLDAFIGALEGLAPPEVLDFLLQLRDEILPGLMAWFQESVVPILDMVAQFVSWKDVLLAVGAAIAAVIIPAIGSLLVSIAPVLLVAAALIAGIALVRNAWEGNWLGIRDKVAEAWAVMGPIFEQVKTWLEVNVPVALAALHDLWVNVAWPAIQAAIETAWNIILPISTAVWTWLSENIPAALETLRSFWVETAWPAIQTAIETVWPIIEHIFTTLRDWVVNTLIPTVQEFYQKWTQEWWPQIQTALQNAWAFIEAAFTELGRWINDNIIPWVEFLVEKWLLGFELMRERLEDVWAIIEPIWIALVEWLEVNIPRALEALQPIFEGVMSGITAAVAPVKSLWDEFVSAVESFWSWITSHSFDFSLNIPDLPDWAVPGSPLPIHTAWKDFAAFVKQTDLTLAMNIPAMPGLREPRPVDNGLGAAGGERKEFHLHLPNATNTPDMIRGFGLLQGLVGIDS